MEHRGRGAQSYLSIGAQTTNMALFFRTIFFLHFSGPIEQIYTHNEMSYVFNVGVITLLDTSFPIFSLHFFFVFINIHEYANAIIFI